MSILQEKMSNYKEVLVNLELLDAFCTVNNTTGQLIMFGGSAILVSLELQNRPFRPTADIDVGILTSSDEKALIESLQAANIDLISGTIEVPPKEDLVDVSKFKLDIGTLDSIEVFVPSMEMLACTKLFSKRQKDLDDLEQTQLLDACDKNKLQDLIDEYTPYVLNPEHPDWNYHKFDDIRAVRGI
ncbi:DUF6036 family nucleotidyltransferase [Solibacillus silvestris]